MSEYERGPLVAYEVTWRSGFIETVLAHQVTFPISDMFGTTQTKTAGHVKFHGEVDGKWNLILAADEADIMTIRRIGVQESK